MNAPFIAFIWSACMGECRCVHASGRKKRNILNLLFECRLLVTETCIIKWYFCSKKFGFMPLCMCSAYTLMPKRERRKYACYGVTGTCDCEHICCIHAHGQCEHICCVQSYVPHILLGHAVSHLDLNCASVLWIHTKY